MNRIALVLLLFLCCCKKNDAGSAKGPTVPFAYTVKYDSVITVYNEVDCDFVFFVKVLAGNIDSNKLNFSFKDLPQGVTVGPQSMLIDHIASGTFTFKAVGVAPGTYPINMEIAGKNISERKRLTLNVKPADYSRLLSGTYPSSSGGCGNGQGHFYTGYCNIVNDTPYVLTISGLIGYSVRAIVSDVITIPVQYAGGYMVWGGGTFKKDDRPGANPKDYLISIVYKRAHGNDTAGCSESFWK